MTIQDIWKSPGYPGPRASTKGQVGRSFTIYTLVKTSSKILRTDKGTAFAHRGEGGQLGAILCKLFKLEAYVKRGEGSKISIICQRSLCSMYVP